MAYSATSVLPDPVGAATSTDRPASRASRDSTWKGSSSNPTRATKSSRTPIRSFLLQQGRVQPRGPGGQVLARPQCVAHQEQPPGHRVEAELGGPGRVGVHQEAEPDAGGLLPLALGVGG